MHNLCIVDAQLIANQWTINGRWMGERWAINGGSIDDRWTINGRSMDDQRAASRPIMTRPLGPSEDSRDKCFDN
eukprot:11203437-Lingulodinium_polyedra.AAC.1